MRPILSAAIASQTGFLRKKVTYNGLVNASIGEASRNVSKLIEAAERGETVVITRRGKPVVRMQRIEPKKRPAVGLFRGRLREIDPAWWHPMSEEEADAFVDGRY